MEIKIERISPDKLSKKEWVFYVDGDPSIRLSEYSEYSRPTTKHKLRLDGRFKGNRPNDWGRGVIKRDQVHIPMYVIHDVRKRIDFVVDQMMNQFWQKNQGEIVK